MTLNFDKQNRNVTEVDLSILQMTRDFVQLGRKKGHPIHYTVINQIRKMCEKALNGSQYTVNLSKLWITPQGGVHLKDMPNLDPQHPAAYLIERVYCRIDLNHASDTEKNMAIGILFNENGYNVAFGVNVRECTNFTVYGDNFYSTYKSGKKANHEAIMELLQKWISEIDVKRDWYFKLVEALKSINFTTERVKEICGDLLQLAVARNHRYKDIESGLDQTQVAQLALKAYEEREKVSVTAWEMLNWGTEMLKPKSADLKDLQADIVDFNNFFIRNYAGLTPEMFGAVAEEVKALELQFEEANVTEDPNDNLEGTGTNLAQ